LRCAMVMTLVGPPREALDLVKTPGVGGVQLVGVRKAVRPRTGHT